MTTGVDGVDGDVATGPALDDNGTMNEPSPGPEATANDNGNDPLIDVAAVANTVLYAPLGLALEARTLMPRFIERGRNQVAMAKMIGQFAVRKGSEDVAAGLLSGQERLVGLLATFGVGGPPTDPVGGSASGGPDLSSSQDSVRPEANRATPHAVEVAEGIDPADLAIDGYDLLSASQVVPRLESLTPDELELIGRYEAGTRARRTILAKVAQLEGGEGSER